MAKEWNVLEYKIPQWKAKMRWSLEPENWITRRLCRYLRFCVNIDYIQAIVSKDFSNKTELL